MFDDKDIRAIFCARGGYGTMKTLEYINFGLFKKDPKWIVGYSDITALHAHVNQNLGIKSIHGTMPFNFPKDGSENESVKTLKECLFGEQIIYKTEANTLNRCGQVEGILVGGNLSVLYSLAGTKYDIETNNKILFLEDLDEYLYHIDRMMMNLKHSGKLNNLKALLVGGMSDMNDNIIPYGKTANEIILDAVKEYDYPVCFNFPAGHVDRNLSIVLGNRVKIKIDRSEVKFSFLQ